MGVRLRSARRESFGNGLVSMLATSWAPPRFWPVALALCLGCPGHDASMPTTCPVTGTVTTELGQPYPGGSLQFRPDSNEDLTVLGDIEKDGTFRLRTLKGSARVEGAPAGSYQVT